MTSVNRHREEENRSRESDEDESESEDNSEECVKRKSRGNKLKYSSDEDEHEHNSDEYEETASDTASSSDDASRSDSDSDFSFSVHTRKKRTCCTKTKSTPRQNKRQTATTTGGAKSNRRSTSSKQINYCEESEHDTDTDDMIYKYEDKKDDDTVCADENNISSGEKKPTQVMHDDAETIEKVLKQRQGRVGAVGSKTAVYNVEEYGDPNVKWNEQEESATEAQYLIKWQGWSHLHNTWESKDSLLQQKVKGLKKLENYLRKEEERRAIREERALSPEDIEYLECQSEMLDNLLETHTIVERVISDKSNDYLCKWQGLPYSECTWEDGDLIRKRFAHLIDEYTRRQSATTFPPLNVKSQRALRVRPKFVPLKDKPEYLGGAEQSLRDYQLDGLNWLANSWCRQNGVILADEMGLGKTVQAISFLSYVFNEHCLYGPFLIVIPLSTIQGWQREFHKWCPQINLVIYLGDSQSRSVIQQYEWSPDNRRIKCNAVLTTYEILLKDKAFFNSVSWAALIVDEAHRLKNEDSLLYRTLIKFDTNHRLLVTGTPLQNSLKELWALLHFIMPDKFNQWEEFDAKYSSVLKDGLKFQDLHKELQPYLLRRVKKDVEKSLPAKVEQILRVEMTKQQKQFYKLILTKNYKELLKGSKGNVSTFLNIMMELKKCSNHTYLIRRDDEAKLNEARLDNLIRGSGKLFLLDKLLRRLKETGHRVLIFSQMVRMLDLIAEYLQFRRFSFQRLDGSIKGEIRRQALDHFNKPDSDDFCFLLSTRAGGLGINLSTADTVIIYDSDWNPQNDLQAQARAHRIGQKNQVNIYRLVSKNSIEEDIVERAKQKMVLDHLVIQRMDTTGRTVLNSRTQSNSNPFTKEEINSILKFGAEELFKEEMESKNDDKDYDIDEILKRAETREETNHLSASDELLSQFKVATFSTMEDDKSWNDIIPESERHKIDLEEEHEKLKLFSETRRQRTQKPKSESKSDEDEYANESANSSDASETKTKNAKNAKSKIKSQSVFNGLNTAEIRRFVRSYRKYPCPLERIDTVAQDAQLEEKSQACLIELASRMRELCVQAIEENKDKKDVNGGKKGPFVDINGAKINAQQILDAEKYFEPLAYYSAQFDQFDFKTKLKQTYWDCEWTNDEDRSLLKGILEYGYGNWESIKSDGSLGLSDKILVTTEKKELAKEPVKLKPQSKHLRTRIDYLMKVLQNQINTDKYGKNWKEILNGSANSTKRKAKNDTDDSDAQHSDVSDKTLTMAKKKRNNSADDVNNENIGGDHVTGEMDADSVHAASTSSVQSGAGTGAKRTNKKAAVKLDKKDKSDKSKIVLSEKIFEECKNILRPVKRALKNLNQLDSDKDIEDIKRYLLEIGDKINDHLTIYSDPEKINLWRNYLWSFVSKFTIKWNWEKLKHLYKKFCNSRDNDLYTQSQLNATNNSSYPSSSSSFSALNNNYYSNQTRCYSKKNFGYHDNRRNNCSATNSNHSYWKSEKSESRRAYASNSSRSRDRHHDMSDSEPSMHSKHAPYSSKSYSSLSTQPGLLGASPMSNRHFNKSHAPLLATDDRDSPSSSPYTSRRLSSHRTGDSCKKLKESRHVSPSRDNQHHHHHHHHHTHAHNHHNNHHQNQHQNQNNN